MLFLLAIFFTIRRLQYIVCSIAARGPRAFLTISRGVDQSENRAPDWLLLNFGRVCVCTSHVLAHTKGKDITSLGNAVLLPTLEWRYRASTFLGLKIANIFTCSLVVLPAIENVNFARIFPIVATAKIKLPQYGQGKCLEDLFVAWTSTSLM